MVDAKGHRKGTQWTPKETLKEPAFSFQILICILVDTSIMLGQHFFEKHLTERLFLAVPRLRLKKMNRPARSRRRAWGRRPCWPSSPGSACTQAVSGRSPVAGIARAGRQENAMNVFVSYCFVLFVLFFFLLFVFLFFFVFFFFPGASGQADWVP